MYPGANIVSRQGIAAKKRIKGALSKTLALHGFQANLSMRRKQGDNFCGKGSPKKKDIKHLVFVLLFFSYSWVRLFLSARFLFWGDIFCQFSDLAQACAPNSARHNKGLKCFIVRSYRLFRIFQKYKIHPGTGVALAPPRLHLLTKRIQSCARLK